MTHVLHRIAGVRVGIDAKATLQPGSAGEVIAVFRRSIYLQLPLGVVCIGGETIGDGPLNLVCHGARREWRSLVSVGAPASVANDAVHMSGARVDLATAAVWSAPDAPCIDAAAFAAGLSLLASELPPSLPEGGLAGIVLADAYPRTAIERRAHVAGRQLADWVRDDRHPPEQVPVGAIDALLGVGPGLTPSGDDYLAGFSFALRVLGVRRKHAALAREISARAGRLTNAISAAHLSAALRGRLKGDLHSVVNAILAGDRMKLVRGLDALAAEDHSSPWDALAGFAIAARARLLRRTALNAPADPPNSASRSSPALAVHSWPR